MSRKIAKVCVRGEIGGRFGGSFVLRNSDIENASKNTRLYERLKASEIELASFVNVSLQASVAHTGNGLTWELSELIHRWNIVPEFANTKLTQTSGSKTSVDAYTELYGDCLFPVGVGYKLLDVYEHEVENYDAQINYTNRPSKMEHTFVGVDEDKLYEYKVYPKIKLFGFDVLALPSAEVEAPPLHFKELKQNYTTYADGNVTVSMKAVIETSSDQNADLSSNKNYGIYVKNNITGREDYYSVQENGSTEFYITLDIPKDKFDVDYNSFIATCDKFLFAIYATDKEGKTSLYDEQEPQIIYDEKPNSITDDIVSVESTSAVINCKYENFGFWDAVCGLEYTSDSKTENLIVFPSDENMQEIHLTDLTPNTKYQYCAYFEVNGTKEYDVYKSFTTDSQPEAITGHHSNETTTTSTIECTYKDVPEDADCGYYISKSYYENASQDGLLSGGVEWNKVSIGWYEGLKVIELSDLMPDEEYQYYAYISIGDEDVAIGDVNSFNTKKPSANLLGNVQVDTNSATIGYGFENVPEGGNCQLILLRVGDAVENTQYISVSNTANGNYTFTGLEASTSYEYMARVEYKSRKWDSSSTGSFTTKTPPSSIAITGDYSNVTKNSATVSCTYENVPEGGVCGVEYIWSGGSSKQPAGSSNGTQSITLSGLEPGTSYTYYAYIEANGQTYYGGNKSFTTDEVIPDLTGTWTCMEYRVSDGTFMERSTITLKSDGSALYQSEEGTPWINTGEGSWIVYGNGTASVNVYFSTETTIISKNIKGTVNNVDNPTSIEGSAMRSTSHVMGGYSEYHCTFIMTKQ